MVAMLSNSLQEYNQRGPRCGPMSAPHQPVLQSGLPCTSAQIARLRLGKPKVTLWFSCLSER